MKYVIMCGGNYKDFDEPKQMTRVHGERLVDRTIRLLREAGAKDICITSLDIRFESCGVPVLKHENNFVVKNDETVHGFWLDAFYPHFTDDTQVTYLFGDVWFTKAAIETIVNAHVTQNTLVGNKTAMNEWHANIGEPFAYIVTDYRTFMEGVEAVKAMHAQKLLLRHPIVWELYRYLNGLDVNIQTILPETYICIDDGTIDIDRPEEIERLGEE